MVCAASLEVRNWAACVLNTELRFQNDSPNHKIRSRIYFAADDNSRARLRHPLGPMICFKVQSHNLFMYRVSRIPV